MNFTRGYTCYKLGDEAKCLLTGLIQTRFRDLIADHITVEFNVPKKLPPDAECFVVGQAYDDRVQALRVSIDGECKRKDGSYYHITWSIDRASGAKPKDANKLLRSIIEGPAPDTYTLTEVDPVRIAVIPSFVPFEGARERWITQDQFYDGSGRRGNCAQAAIAGLLNLPLSDVPNFVERGDEMHLWIRDWMDERGFDYVWERNFHPDGYYLASGPSSRGCSHMVVMKDRELFHDPHPSREGLLSIEQTYHLIPHDPSLMRAK